MSKVEIVAHVAEEVGMTKKDAEKAVNAVLDAITKSLADGERVQLIGFGTFEVKHRNARTGRNPHDGTAMPIPARDIPNFKPGKALREAVA